MYINVIINLLLFYSYYLPNIIINKNNFKSNKKIFRKNINTISKRCFCSSACKRDIIPLYTTKINVNRAIIRASNPAGLEHDTGTLTNMLISHYFLSAAEVFTITPEQIQTGIKNRPDFIV